MSQHYARATLLYSQNRFSAALVEIQRHLAEDPQDPMGLSLLGKTLSELKRGPEALQAAAQAISLAPEAAETHSAMAEILIDQGKHKKAIPVVNEALRLDPDSVRDYCLLAVINLNLSRWEKALQASEQALALDPEDDQALNMKAVALKRLGKKEEAGLSLQAAMAKNPEDAYTHANQGWLLLERNQIEPALNHFQEALRIDPRLDWARQGIVQALKARNIIFRTMLNFFFWMSNFSPRMRWIIILGAWAVINVMNSVRETLGPLEFLVTPLIYGYLGFVVMSWIANSLFNFVLRFDHYGKLALSKLERTEANWIAVCLASSGVLLGCYLWTGSKHFDLGWPFCLVLVIPVTVIFSVRKGLPRNSMIIYTLGLAGLLGGTIAYGLLRVDPVFANSEEVISQLKASANDTQQSVTSLLDSIRLKADDSLNEQSQDESQMKLQRLSKQVTERNSVGTRYRRLILLLQAGLLSSRILPAVLPGAEEENEVDVRFS